MDPSNGINLLYQVLQEASSQNPDIMKPAESKLSEWESQQGFYVALLKVVGTFEFDTQARFLAAIHLKNGVEKNWRKVNTAIPDEDKASIKLGLEQLMLIEPMLNIASIIAIVVSKISRLEIREWPTLLPILLENIRSDDINKQHRALMVSYHVVKILSTKRLTGDRKIFHEMTSEIFDYLRNLWDNLFCVWASSGESGDTLQRAHYALKILRILSVRGYQTPHENKSIVEFLPTVMTRVKETLQLRASRQDSSTLLEKHIINMWKIVGDMLEIHPLSFVPFLQSGLEFATYFGFSEEGRSLIFERVAIHALNLMKSILLCPEFRAPRNYGHASYEGRKHNVRDTTPDADPLTLEAADIKERFFSAETLTILVRVLVTNYLPLTSAEMESWNDGPEEFAIRMEETGETWKYNLRQSAETLLVTFFKEFKKSPEILLTIMNEFQAPLKDPQDLQTTLAKDALYNAAGLNAFELYDEFSFDTWLTTTLVPELALPAPILHRRITWLVGQWSGVKVLPESRPMIYSILLSGLRSPDVVVRLSSSQSLRSCLDDFDFDPEQFVSCMHDAFHLLFTLLQDVTECDNKMRVLHTMSFLIERMAVQIKNSSIIGPLAQFLPQLWTADHNMLKAAVVSTSIQLVNALGSDSHVMREFTFPVIKISTDLKSQEHVYLLEDGIDLWLALLEHASSCPDDSLISLVDNLIPLLSIATEHLKQSLALVNAYNLLYPEAFAEKFGAVICTELNSSVNELRAEGVTLVLRTVELMIRSSPNHGPMAIKPILGKIFQSAFLGMETPILLSLYFSIVCRLLLISEPVFQYGIESVAVAEGKSTSEALCTIIDVICDKFYAIAQLERKKLICIGLLKLLSTADQGVLLRTCGILLAVSETLNDLMKLDGNGKRMDSLCEVDFDTSSDTEEWITENDMRKKRLAAQDVVYTVDLHKLFSNEMGNLRLRLGEATFTEVMGTVDVETMQMVKSHLE